jgi:hypothetical protein
MKVNYTDAGTPIIEQTEEEYNAYVERQVQREIGMSAAEFTEAYMSGKIDHSHPSSGYLVGLLRLGHNGNGRQPVS